MKMFRASIIALALQVACAPAFAQWQVPNDAVPIGQGGGVTGFAFAAPGAAGQPLASNGGGALPSFQALPNAGLAVAPAFTLKGNATGSSAAPQDISIPALTQKNVTAPADEVLLSDSAASGALKNAPLSSVTPLLFGPQQLFVNSALGSDSNACVLSGANACKTIQHAVNLAINATAYAAGAPTINIADGTYPEQVVCAKPLVGASTLTIVGDNTTPTNVVWAPPATLVGLNVTNGCNVTLSGVFFNGPTACAYLDTFNGTISFQTVNFGAINNVAGCGEHILADHGGIVNILGPYTISGNMVFHILAVGPSFIQHVEASFSMPSALTFSDFYSISGPANVNYDQTVTCSGSGCGSGSTGAPFTITGNGSISSNSSTIPGNGNGILQGGGCKDGSCGANIQNLAPGTLAGAGTCNSAIAGSIATITDSNTAVWGATIASGGAQTVLGFCNGSAWTVMGL